MILYLKNRSAQGFVLASVIVRRGARAITVVLKGEGPVRYTALAVEQKRLAVDFPGGRSLLQVRTLPVNHSLLHRIRIGRDSRRLRVVFDVGAAVRYAVRTRPNALVLQFRSTGGP